MAKRLDSHYPIVPMLRELPLSEPALRILSLFLRGVSLPSALDIRALIGLDEKYVSAIVKDLIDNEYLMRKKLGWACDLTGRMWLTDKINRELGTCGHIFNEPWFLARRLERLPLVEAMYPALARVTHLGPFMEIHWHARLAFDASVNFKNGWLVVCYSGMLENTQDIRNRISNMAADLREHRLDSTQAWPSIFLWIVNSRWQAALVKQAASIYGLDDVFALYVAADGTYIPASKPLVATGDLYQALEERDMGGWPWEQRLADAPWTKRDSLVLGKVLDSVIRFPGAWFSLIQADTGVNDPKRVRRALSRLGRLQLHWVESRRYKGQSRYTVTGPGFHVAARRDGVSNVGWRARAYVPAFRERPRHQDHEDGSMHLYEGLINGGCLVEPPWRAGDDLGQLRGGIVPDGTVYLTRGPYGPGWYYVEYERSARGKARAEAKLKGYLSQHRRDNYPVLFVLWNEVAEQNFQEIGREHGLRMVTTTIKRLETYGAVGSPGCWSLYGESVVIG